MRWQISVLLCSREHFRLPFCQVCQRLRLPFAQGATFAARHCPVASYCCALWCRGGMPIRRETKNTFSADIGLRSRSLFRLLYGNGIRFWQSSRHRCGVLLNNLFFFYRRGYSLQPKVAYSSWSYLQPQAVTSCNAKPPTSSSTHEANWLLFHGQLRWIENVGC